MNINVSPHRGPGCGHTAVAGIDVISPAGLETFKSEIQFGGELQTQPLVNMLSNYESLQVFFFHIYFFFKSLSCILELFLFLVQEFL